VAYLKHHADLRDFEGPVALVANDPQCGWYRRRMVKNAAFIGVAIWLEQDIDEAGELVNPPMLRCLRLGKLIEPLEEWSYICQRPIPYPDYKYMIDYAAWAAQYKPDDPACNPFRPVESISMPF
jgi:hypothetical protein